MLSLLAATQLITGGRPDWTGSSAARAVINSHFCLFVDIKMHGCTRDSWRSEVVRVQLCKVAVTVELGCLRSKPYTWYHDDHRFTIVVFLSSPACPPLKLPQVPRPPLLMRYRCLVFAHFHSTTNHVRAAAMPPWHPGLTYRRLQGTTSVETTTNSRSGTGRADQTKDRLHLMTRLDTTTRRAKGGENATYVAQGVETS